MSRSKSFFITLFVLLIGGICIFYFYFYNKTPAGDPNTNNRQNFFGFEQNPSDNGTSDTQNGSSTDFEITNSDSSTMFGTSTTPEPPRLRLISSSPVAGADFIVRNAIIGTTSTTYKGAVTVKTVTAPTEFIRYILKANGNIYETASSTVQTVRLSNATIPKLQEAFFDGSGDRIIIRNTIGDDGIQTRLVKLQSISPTGTSSAQNQTEMAAILSDLPANITEMSVSGDRSKIYYTKNSNPRGTISQFDGGVQVGVFNSPFREWLSQWGGSTNPKTVFLNTKPSVFSAGFLYALDTVSGSIKKIVGNVSGLTSLVSKDGLNLIYSGTDSGTPDLNVFSLRDSSERSLFTKTLPEKCVWGNRFTEILYCAVPKNMASANYPDDWYMGLAHFNDDLYVLDLRRGAMQLILSPDKITGVPFDITNLKIDKNDDYLIFTEKNTMSLWGVRLN